MNFVKEKINEHMIRFNFFISSKAAFELLKSSAQFRTLFIKALSSGFKQYFLEFPMYEPDILFEFIQVKTVLFKKLKPNFLPYFQKQYKKGVATFDNLSKDTRLIVPENLVNSKAYLSIGDFMRSKSIPIKQKHELIRRMASELLKLSKTHNKLWLSTHGLGVHWLHVRINIGNPKYYKSRYKRR